MKKKTLSDLDFMRERVKQKRQDYIRYDFSPRKNDVLKTFFDLAQEYDEIEDFYLICVAVLEESFHVECRLYLLNQENKRLELVCDSRRGVFEKPKQKPEHIYLSLKPYEIEPSFFSPIIISAPVAEKEIFAKSGPVCIGILEVYPLFKITESDKFFLTKYTNRIGYNLRKKMLARQNVTHLQFIKNLVSDIEHNVIIPNMYFKHLFRQLRKRIADLNELQEMVRKEHGEGGDDQSCRHVSDKISTIRQALDAACTEIDKHHENTSLFLESLFRRDHFEKGRFVLRSKNLNVENEIIGPQLDHYQQRLLARGIAIERSEDLKNENFIIQADFGLLAQVYANFFSNAVKYTNEVIDNNGKPRKAMAYGRKILYNYYGPGKPGVKFNVFTTGHHLPGDEVHHLFDDGFKGSNSSETNSHGHGLAFVKMVIELHGGIVGHELTEQGNNFYFILPIVSVQPNTSA